MRVAGLVTHAAGRLTAERCRDMANDFVQDDEWAKTIFRDVYPQLEGPLELLNHFASVLNQVFLPVYSCIPVYSWVFL